MKPESGTASRGPESGTASRSPESGTASRGPESGTPSRGPESGTASYCLLQMVWSLQYCIDMTTSLGLSSKPVARNILLLQL